MQDLNKLFDDLRKAEVVKVETGSQSSSRLSDDPRFIHFRPGNTYRVRLLYYIPDGVERKSPFINKYTHHYFNEEKQTLHWVVCPTSEYISDRRGFKECKICDALSKFYKEGEQGNAASAQLYRTFKRRFNGFVLVYVINDPTNEENNGTIKIMRYGVLINRFFKREIFGIDAKENKVLDIDVVGADAFKTKKGYDLVITVGKNITAEREFNSYDCKFARKASDIDIENEDIAKAVKDLDFDSDFYEKSTKDEIQTFYNQFVLREEIGDADVEQVDQVIENDIPDDFKAVEEVKEDKSSKKAIETPTDIDDVDVDSLLEQVNSEY